MKTRNFAPVRNPVI